MNPRNKKVIDLETGSNGEFKKADGFANVIVTDKNGKDWKLGFIPVHADKANPLQKMLLADPEIAKKFTVRVDFTVPNSDVPEF